MDLSLVRAMGLIVKILYIFATPRSQQRATSCSSAAAATAKVALRLSANLLGAGVLHLEVVITAALVLHVGGPEGEVITEQLHDEGGILVGLLGEGVELGDGVVEGLLGEDARLGRLALG